VIDKKVVVGAGAIVGTGNPEIPNEQMPDRLFAGITVVGKGAYIPEGAQIGRNVLINSRRDETDFPEDRIVPDGKTI
jgi:glucose-1-phosphate adenylyltransferase